MRALRAGICALIAFAVLALGGVEPSGQAVLEIGAAALFVWWAILAIRRRQVEIHGNWLYLPLVGLGLFAMVQYVAGMSVYPYVTKIELLEWAACLLLFFLTVESFCTVALAKQLIWFLVALGFVVSLFGIVQHFTSNGRLYWSIPLAAGGSPFGPYVNRDDFAGFVELVAPLGLALLFFRACRREHVALLFLFTIVPLGAAILSASRGGIIGLVLEFVLVLFLSRVRRMGKRQVLIATALTLVAGAFVVWLGVSEAIQRFEQLTPEESSYNLRLSLYRDTWRIFVHHPWFGTGLGTLRTVYPRYATFYLPGVIVNHAHNDYLELLAEMGVVGGLCGLAFIGLLVRQGLRNLQAAETPLGRAIVAGSLVACMGLLLHSLVDFNLHIPANALIFVLLACLGTAEFRPPAEVRTLASHEADAMPNQTWASEPPMIRTEAKPGSNHAAKLLIPGR
ncbi:MAG TPA: O-antigen ligase family protein [Candidatus Acidoferrales bacterium]|nr:O-antigen ligase family protein [Candidatus Acidoferrales bacterium]